VIAIIGILSGLIVVSMNGVTDKATAAKAQVFSSSLRNALMLNLVAEYKLDGSADDFWGGKNGTLHGTTTITSDCPQGSCLSFNGISSYINVPDDAIFNFGSKMTAMVWVKASAQSNGAVLSQYNNLITKRSWYIFSSTTAPYNQLGVTISDDGTLNSGHSKSYFTNKIVFDNKWHYIGFTFNSGLLKLYIDGEEATTTKSSDDAITSIYNSDVDLGIGCTVCSGTEGTYFVGAIDEVRLFNSSVPTSQIKEQYYAGLNSLLASGNISSAEYQSRLLIIANK
jgi:type II secretory pathway pseudopilin PulG